MISVIIRSLKSNVVSIDCCLWASSGSQLPAQHLVQGSAPYLASQCETELGLGPQEPT